MTVEELIGAYTRGQCDAYNAMFKAFITAFNEGQDIHWLRDHICAQFADVLATQVVRETL